jgi:hypothetical protein
MAPSFIPTEVVGRRRLDIRRTHEPGVFEIEAENTTSHVASFAV